MAAILFSFGIISVSINVPSSTLIQEKIAFEKQGRVFGAMQLAQGIAQLLGMGIVSLIAEYVLPMYVLLASSTLCAIIIFAGMIYSGIKGLMGNDYTESEKSDNTELSSIKDEPLVFDEKERMIREELELDQTVPTIE